MQCHSSFSILRLQDLAYPRRGCPETFCFRPPMFPERCSCLLRIWGERRRGASSCVGYKQSSFDLGHLSSPPSVAWTFIAHPFISFTFSCFFVRAGKRSAKLHGGQAMIWRGGMKRLASALTSARAARFPSWGPRDGCCLDQNRRQWRECRIACLKNSSSLEKRQKTTEKSQ